MTHTEALEAGIRLAAARFNVTIALREVLGDRYDVEQDQPGWLEVTTR